MLNTSLNLLDLADRYRERRRLQIPNLLTAPVADRLHHCLVQETPWGIVYNEGGKVVQLMAEQLRALPPDDGAKLVSGAIARARSEFQFLYHFYPMLTAYQARRDPGLFLHEMLEGLNSAPVLDFVRQVTGISSLVKADAQATLYAPGHFLTRHNDGAATNLNRRVAYVLSMTKGWHPDYGALLQFYDDADRVTDVFVPGFNTLSLFTVPQQHAVSYTAPFAPVGRFAITGWFQDP